jgi:hypothetical protein
VRNWLRIAVSRWRSDANHQLPKWLRHCQIFLYRYINRAGLSNVQLELCCLLWHSATILPEKHTPRGQSRHRILILRKWCLSNNGHLHGKVQGDVREVGWWLGLVCRLSVYCSSIDVSRCVIAMSSSHFQLYICNILFDRGSLSLQKIIVTRKETH